MDKSTETHDFMNVDSFSQLPFIRTAPLVKAEKGIRLFGIEFGTGDHNDNIITTITGNSTDQESHDSSAGGRGGGGGGAKVNDHVKDTENNADDSCRKFECHYCCRNFPTSQALGGHQNAHKRERQHAKRAHLQSTMAHNSSTPDGHLCGLLNYDRFGSSPTSTLTLTTYPSWNYTTAAATAAAATTSTTTTNNRFYGFSHHNHHQQRPINGSPLALWRIPAVHRNNQSFNADRTIQGNPLPLFSGDHHHHHDLKSVQMINGSSSQNQHMYKSKPNVNDHVSLDLRL